MLIFDIETDGFYDVVTKVHCIAMKDTVSGTSMVFNQRDRGFEIERALALLEEVDCICGHNIIKYDIPVLKKLYPWFNPEGKVLDTLILARLAVPELGDLDSKLVKSGRLPAKHFGAHKLEAWGYRLGVLKGEFDGPWDVWTQEMQDYNVQDVVVTEKLLEHLQQFPVSAMALAIEQDVARIISRQEINGICFDEKAALDLYATLSKERLALEDDLKARFGYWYAIDGALVPKADNKRHGYVKDAPLTKVKKVVFNPGSRHHIAKVLKERFGWRPTSFTPKGEPEVNEAALKGIKHPEAATLIQYLTVEKRIGQLAEGKEAWLKHVKPDGRIHGSVNTQGTVTGRMAHSFPNLAQVPAVYSPYGKECRSLFGARPGWKLVGIDAAGLEARCLAHFMAFYDGGAYAKVVVEGRKEDGTDIHTVNMKAIGIDSRDDAKTWFYAFIYGAGDEKLGMIVTKVRNRAKNSKLGKALRASFLKNLAAMGRLIKAIKAKARKQKWLKGLDGRKLHVRSEHAAPNTLLQSAGAVVMKRALVLLDNTLQLDLGLKPGEDYEFVLNVHDEWQIECRPELADQVGQLAVQAIRDAGKLFGFRCPLDGEYRVGASWADTH